MMWGGRQNEERWRAAVKAVSMNWTTQPPYHDELLSLCNTLLNENKYQLAVVVAQMACEILADQTLTPLLKDRELPWNFNVHNRRVLKLYKDLTRDEIDTAPFWSPYETHAVRRHEVAHRGRRVNETEARE